MIDEEEKAIYTVTIGTDNYYLQYEVKVGAFNDHGDGPNSTVSLIYSAEGSKYHNWSSVEDNVHIISTTKSQISLNMCYDQFRFHCNLDT